jgi:hypothetical protein
MPLGKQQALNSGCPNFRWVDVPRVGTGEERVNQFIDKAIKALTDPLTAKEKEVGVYTPPADPKICYNGNPFDAQTFFQKTTPIANCRNCPIANWTDGLPIIVPTEQLVKEMLTGTSHKGDEYIKYNVTSNITLSSSGVRVSVKVGDPMFFMPNCWGATVEKVAVNAVMAGCKPEYLPVVLAIEDNGSQLTTTNCMWGYWQIVSGPIAKEIGMNAGQGALNPGNPANASIGRAFQLCMINLGGAAQGVTRIETPGSPFNLGGFCLAEDVEALPAGWLGMNEEATYPSSGPRAAAFRNADGTYRNFKKTESVVMTGGSHGTIHAVQFAPSSFRALNSGQGGLARRLGIPEGKAGNYNFLEYIIPELIAASEFSGSHTFIMHANMAQSLLDYGFKSKLDVGNWISKAGTVPAKTWKTAGWFDFLTSGGTRNVPGTTTTWNDIADDYPYQLLGGGSSQNIIVSIHPGDEICMTIQPGKSAVHDIDYWR